MTWPDSWPTVTVGGDYTAAGPSGSVASGTVEFDTVPGRLASSQYGVIAVGTIVGTLAGGMLSVTLAAVDSLVNLPFVWRVTEKLVGQPVRSYYISLPAGTSPVSLATAVYTGELPASYTVITGPQGLQGVKGDKGNDGGGGNYDPAGSAAQALADAETYTDTKMAAEVVRADAAYDHAGTAGTAAGTALTSAKAYADAGDTTTLTAAKAYTDAHSGSGPAPPLIRSVRIVSDNNSGLPSAPTWRVVVTSGVTTPNVLPSEPLQCTIPAAAGNRIRVVGSFMRNGSHFLDWVLLAADGSISQYAVNLGSDHPTRPGGEGNPAMYPSVTFAYVAGPPLFTVGPEHISGGHVTIGLAHQGTGTGVVYAYEDSSIPYAFALRLENIDQTAPAP